MPNAPAIVSITSSWGAKCNSISAPSNTIVTGTRMMHFTAGGRRRQTLAGWLEVRIALCVATLIACSFVSFGMMVPFAALAAGLRLVFEALVIVMMEEGAEAPSSIIDLPGDYAASEPARSGSRFHAFVAVVAVAISRWGEWCA